MSTVSSEIRGRSARPAQPRGNKQLLTQGRRLGRGDPWCGCEVSDQVQGEAVVLEGDRDAAYDYDSLLANKEPWDNWNPEQQAYLVQKYWKAQRAISQASKDGKQPQQKDVDLVKQAQPYIDQVRSG